MHAPQAMTRTDTPAGSSTWHVPTGDRRLKRAAISGSRWGVVSGVVEQVVSALTTAVLARLLAPQDFGAVAAATVIVGLFALITRFGLGASVINRRDMDDRIASSAFWLALCVGVTVTAVAALSAPAAATLIGQPDAGTFIAVASTVVLFNQVAGVSSAMLLRRLRFRSVYFADIVGTVGYAVLAVALATLGLGAWAVIYGRVGSACARMFALLLGAGWRPRLVFDLGVIRQDLRFNAGFLGAMLSGYGAKNGDYWVVSRMAGASGLGVYYLAYVLPGILRQRVTWLTNDILFPILSRMRDRPDALLRGFAQVLQLVAFAALPALLGLAVVSDLVIDVFLGSRWAPAAVPMAVLAASAAVESTTQVTTTVFVAKGRPGQAMVVNLARLAVLAVGLVVAIVVGGLPAVAVAVLASTVAGAGAAQWLGARGFGLTWSLLARTLMPVVVPTVVMLGVVAGVKATLVAEAQPVLALTVLTGLGGVVYLASGLLLSRRAFLRTFRQLRLLVTPTRGAGSEDAATAATATTGDE